MVSAVAVISIGTVSTWVPVSAVMAAVAAGKRYSVGNGRVTGTAAVSVVLVTKQFGRVSTGAR